MIFLGLLPWNTYSAILKRGALQALLCVLKEEQCRNFFRNANAPEARSEAFLEVPSGIEPL